MDHEECIAVYVSSSCMPPQLLFIIGTKKMPPSFLSAEAKMSLTSAFPTPSSLQAPGPSSEPNPTKPTLTTSRDAGSASGAMAPTAADPPERKPKPSAQLNRWSRARAIRSGRTLDRPAGRAETIAVASPPPSPVGETGFDLGDPTVGRGGGDEEEEGAREETTRVAAKAIYMVSDGTGWTAEYSVKSALGQFEHCLVDRGCPVNTHLFSGIDDVERLMEIVKQAAIEGAMLVYTLADPSIAEAAQSACKLWGVPSTDILSPITEAIASHLGVSPSGLPRGAPGRNSTLTQEYFRRIDAIEFTIKHDDGVLPKYLDEADIVLAGVSRTGKTPLSIYLAQMGYKVANVPIVMGVQLPSTLFQVDGRKVFGLTINSIVLQTIRKTRAKSLGFNDDERCNYSEMDHVRRELEYAGKIFAQNPSWPVIEVTGKAIEETAAVILRLYHDRKEKCFMPRISKRY